MLSGCGNLSRRKPLSAKPKLYIPAVIVVEIRPALLPRPFFSLLAMQARTLTTMMTPMTQKTVPNEPLEWDVVSAGSGGGNKVLGCVGTLL
nr:hypothetical protein Iba_scaffold37842CG0030 [Ipomoea batatas]